MLEQQKKQMNDVVEALKKLEESNRQDQEKSRTVLEQKFLQIQESNEKKLDEMRQTVDEKLHSTLEKRLGESFKLVSDRLEAVQRGLGEMKSLADGVGDLKRVLTNVKDRGTWGEYQLGAILEQTLTPEQYARNVRPKEGGETVEFAIKLPGKGLEDARPVWLPVDAKFPRKTMRGCSTASSGPTPRPSRRPPQHWPMPFEVSQGHPRQVCRPTRHDGLRDHVPPDGGALRRGLAAARSARRAADQVPGAGHGADDSLGDAHEPSSWVPDARDREALAEVWNVLAAVKTEFGKFGEVLEKVKRQLSTASDTIDKTQVRTRAMEKKLRSVEQLPSPEAERSSTSQRQRLQRR